MAMSATARSQRPCHCWASIAATSKSWGRIRTRSEPTLFAAWPPADKTRPNSGGGFARYCKEVDAAENTTLFWQEIYDRGGKLVARHQKFPLDLGHQNV